MKSASSPPLEFRTLPCPTYPEIRLSLLPQAKVNRTIREFDPDVLHIATEGPLGMAARRFALRHDFPFTHRLSHALPGICARPACGCH